MSKTGEKVALITGGSSGVGLATAKKLSALGYTLVISGRDLAKLEEAKKEFPSSAIPPFVIPTDVSEEQQVKQLVEGTIAKFGKIDLVFAAAGVSMRAPFEESKINAIEYLMKVNFFGVLYLLHHSLPFLKKTKGSFVAMSSLTGKRGVPEYSIYGASKFALQGLLDSVRMEVDRDGVHIGVISTGFIDTPLRQRILGGDGKVLTKTPVLPFRLWPLEKCIAVVMKVILKRQRDAIFPGFVRPLLGFDPINFGRMGDRYLINRFGYQK